MTGREIRQHCANLRRAYPRALWRIAVRSLNVMKFQASIFLFLAAFAAVGPSADAAEPAEQFPTRPPVVALSAQEEQKTFQLPPGYRLELLLSEPAIKEPVAIAFDGNGRMFVAEMRSYMQDIDGADELAAVSRVSLHWSSKGDGVYDQHRVFADNLLLPRLILPLGPGQLVIGETNTNDLYLHTDTDGDGVADKKELWFSGGPRGGNLEHQPGGLLWALDNGIYTTFNSYRLRWTPQGVLKEATAANNGQWGLGQDNDGRLFFANAGGEKGMQSFQTPTVYGMFNPEEQIAPGFNEVWPAVGVGDMEAGPRRRRADGTLNHFSGTAGAEIYRGDRLPAELGGDLFVGEPVGRLVRRAKVETHDALTTLSNPYQAQQTEFLRSTDLCFRPVNFATAPDGTLYVVDMYRGIIQEGTWVKKGSYLRNVVEQYSFDKVVGRGRIWRLVHETTKLGPPPAMNQETAAQLVDHLAHPNGWWRDTAQRLLILKQDPSVVPALTAMAGKNKNPLARTHALWTLEGLAALSPELVRAALGDAEPQVRVAAIRVSESLFKKGETTLTADVLARAQDADARVVLQTLLTASLLNWPDWKTSFSPLVANSPLVGVKVLGDALLNPPVPAPPAQNFSSEEKKVLSAGAEIFQTLCASCHGADGKGVAMPGAAPAQMLAPPLAGSKTITGLRDGAISVLLHGLTGEIDGKKYGGLMIPMASNDDAWIANVLSYARTSFGNRAGLVTAPEVARLRASTKDRTQPWTVAELHAALPQPLEREGWKLTSSHNAASVGAAIDNNPDSRWSSDSFQAPGIWLQIELPQETALATIRLDTGKSPNDFPRVYQVQLSGDGQTWSKPVVEKTGDGALTDIELAAAKTQFIRITLTGAAADYFWSIHDLQIFAARPDWRP